MTELNDSEKLFLQEKVPVALIFIASSRITYISEVADAIGSNFAHTKKVVTKLEKGGYISSFFQGRTRYLHLTPKGYHLAESLKAVMALINTDADSFSFPSAVDDDDAAAGGVTPEMLASSAHPVGGDGNEGGFDSCPEGVDGPGGALAGEEADGLTARKLTEDVSTALFLERINAFSARVRGIYELQVAGGADHEAIRRNLGPFDRELKMIERDMRAERIANAELMLTFRKAADMFATYMGRPPKV